ncbi:hypothetical protein DFA_05961 [Cavenderia fasciculata]|uniref:MYND-type domain-containing protein n=1 Tax=Cavenderia fasciculata TaxID=261658 RepID=F4PJQ1_CACFS|nr:uncharacterized protein DFA_05961 [Cavenderia fasciculata]EGG23825.1 hypothetical protein DFA_05961 [Cavenderia fasciculata]|eukprot:XP_004361676.1 hypothetical protein DFA_05961 [Cavenderia fasciculata]
MASVYTTKRGKTKKAKLGIRKDSKNNQANKLVQQVRQTTTKKSQADVINPLDFSDKWNNLKLTGEEERRALALVAKCQFKQCKSGGKIDGTPLMLCGACQSVSYCSRDCQVGDWKLHKEKCKDYALKKQNANDDLLKTITETIKQLEILKTTETTSSSTIQGNPWIDDNGEPSDDEEGEDEPPKKSNDTKIATSSSTSSTATTTSSGANGQQSKNVNWSLFKDEAFVEEQQVSGDEQDGESSDE